MLALGLTAFVAVPSSTFAQNRQGGNNGGQGGDRMAEFRQRMMDDLKKQLDAKDDEWQVIQPRVEKVFAAQQAMRVRTFGGGNFGRGGDRGGDRGTSSRGGDTQATSPVQAAARELTTALEKKDTPQDQIAAKLATLREAKAKAKTELEAAQKSLQEVLQPRQEAVLVGTGMLD
jgi:hypothetical protein